MAALINCSVNHVDHAPLWHDLTKEEKQGVERGESERRDPTNRYACTYARTYAHERAAVNDEQDAYCVQ